MPAMSLKPERGYEVRRERSEPEQLPWDVSALRREGKVMSNREERNCGEPLVGPTGKSGEGRQKAETGLPPFLFKCPLLLRQVQRQGRLNGKNWDGVMSKSFPFGKGEERTYR